MADSVDERLVDTLRSARTVVALTGAGVSAESGIATFRDEDEFLLSLNRFNVMASRARAKLIVFVSQEVVDHLSSDMDVLRGSALLKTFAETFCSRSRPMRLGYLPANAQPRLVDGLFRWRP
jgi:hypothetical protein